MALISCWLLAPKNTGPLWPNHLFLFQENKEISLYTHILSTGLLCASSRWSTIQFSSVQSLSHVRLFVTPWTTAHQASLSITNSQSLLKLIFIELVIPSNHLILCLSLLLLPSIFPSIRVFSNESVLHSRWPKYWSFGFNISTSNGYSGLISFRMGWLDLLAVMNIKFTMEDNILAKKHLTDGKWCRIWEKDVHESFSSSKLSVLFL